MLLSVFGLCVVFWSQSFEFLWVYGSFWFWERIMFCLCSVLVTALGLLVHFCDSVSYLSLCLCLNVPFLFWYVLWLSLLFLVCSRCISHLLSPEFFTLCVYCLSLLLPLVVSSLDRVSPRLFSSRLCPSFLRGLPLTPTVCIPDSSVAVIFVFLENCNIKAVFESRSVSWGHFSHRGCSSPSCARPLCGFSRSALKSLTFHIAAAEPCYTAVWGDSNSGTEKEHVALWHVFMCKC